MWNSREDSKYSGIIRLRLLCEGEKEGEGKYTVTDYGDHTIPIFQKCPIRELSKFKEAWAHISHENGYPEIKNLWEELEKAMSSHNTMVDETEKRLKIRIDKGIRLPDKIYEGAGPDTYILHQVWSFFMNELEYPDRFYVNKSFNAQLKQERFAFAHVNMGELGECGSEAEANRIIDFLKKSHSEIHSELASIKSNILNIKRLRDEFSEKMSKEIIHDFDVDKSGYIAFLKGRCWVEDKIDGKFG